MCIHYLVRFVVYCPLQRQQINGLFNKFYHLCPVLGASVEIIDRSINQRLSIRLRNFLTIRLSCMFKHIYCDVTHRIVFKRKNFECRGSICTIHCWQTFHLNILNLWLSWSTRELVYRFILYIDQSIQNAFICIESMWDNKFICKFKS